MGGRECPADKVRLNQSPNKLTMVLGDRDRTEKTSAFYGQREAAAERMRRRWAANALPSLCGSH